MSVLYIILILYSIRAPQYPSLQSVSQSTHFERLDLLGKEHTEAGIEQAVRTAAAEDEEDPIWSDHQQQQHHQPPSGDAQRPSDDQAEDDTEIQ